MCPCCKAALVQAGAIPTVSICSLGNQAASLEPGGFDTQCWKLFTCLEAALSEAGKAIATPNAVSTVGAPGV